MPPRADGLKTPRWVPGAVVLLLTAVVFWPAVGHDFILIDDDRYVTANAWVRSGLNFRSAGWALTTLFCEFWHPLTWLSLMLDSQVYGTQAWGYHLTNVLLHALNSGLLFVVLTRFKLAPWPAALAAILFAVHPLRVEPVAWIAERKGLLNALFFLGSVFSYLAYAEKPAASKMAAVSGLFALSLAAKPASASLPLLLLALDSWPLGRWKKGLAPLAAEKWPLWGLAAGAALLTFVAQQGNLRAMSRVPLGLRLLDSVTAYGSCLAKTLWPAKLTLFYPTLGLDPVPGSAAWRAARAALLLAALSAAAWRARRRLPELWAGWLWYLVAPLPVLGVVRNTFTELSDRYSYLPHIGLAFAAAAAASRLKGPARRWTAAAACALALLWTGLTRAQLAHWTSSWALCTYSVEAVPNCGWTRNALGTFLLQKGESQAALDRFDEAVRLRPGYAQARNNLGIALSEAGRAAEALEQLRSALRLEPDLIVDYNIGVVLAKTGKLAEAQEEAQRSLSAPENFRSHAQSLYADILCRRGRCAEALEHYREALRLRPDNAEATGNEGAALALLGRSSEGVAGLRRALLLKPDLKAAQANLRRLQGAPALRPDEVEWAEPMILMTAL
ncbi:MAG: tetratricopeptide repeat protein [Elusimicrobia bacterium]|nr:tetratricopeptide repeat protein [Elusimicrobiota bacterium]